MVVRSKQAYMCATVQGGTMARPVIGIIGNRHLINGEYRIHGAGITSSAAVAEVCDCLPLMVPTAPSLVNIDDLMD